MGNNMENVIAYAKQTYQTEPERPWQMYPENVVLRHEDNRKWYGLLMEVQAENLGLTGAEKIPVLNVRLDSEMVSLLRGQEGFRPAYHMNKKNWLTVLLDGQVPMEQVLGLLDQSYAVTQGRKKKGIAAAGPKVWLVPSNPKYFDLVGNFTQKDEVLWKQSTDVKPGDLVYMYVGAPYSAILYKCRALEVDLPYEGTHEVLNITRLMRLSLLYTYDSKAFTLKNLKRYGVVSVRGPRYLPSELKQDLDWAEKNSAPAKA